MNEKCKYCDYVSKCSRICEYNSYLCKVHRSFPKVVDKSYEQLQQENKQLKEKLDWDLQWALKYEKQVGNWNKLKDYVSAEWYSYDNDSVECEVAKDILDKMQELEQGSDSNVKD